MYRVAARLTITATMVVLTTLLVAEVVLRRRADGLSTPAQFLPPATQQLRWADVAAARRVVVLGDSIAAGSGLSDAAAWPVLLEAGLNRAYPAPWRVINAGIPGETAAQGLLRIDRDVLRWHPHVVLIAFGLNDARLSSRRSVVDTWRAGLVLEKQQAGRLYALGWLQRRLAAAASPAATPSGLQPRLPPDVYTLALGSIVAQVRQADPAARCVLLGLTPVDYSAAGSLDPGGSAAQAAAYDTTNRTARDLAATLSIPFVDTAGALAAYPAGVILTADGIHLTARGQAAIAEMLLVQWPDLIRNRKSSP